MTRSPGATTWCGLAVVAGAAAVLSFEALGRLAMLSGTPAALAWLLPVSIDAAAVVAARMWLSVRVPSEARSFARTLALGMIALSVAGNALPHALRAYDVVPPWWTVVAVAAPPLVLGSVAHLAALASTRAPAEHVEVAEAAVEAEPTQAGPDIPGEPAEGAGEPAPVEPGESPGEAGDDLVERARPRVVVIDECQSFFMQSDGAAAKEAAELTKKLVDAARKYAITLVFATPTPSADTLPRAIVSVLSNRACFATGDQTGNDAVLGTGSYKAGVSAVGLEPKTAEGPGDIGTAMTRGFTAKPSLLRCMRVAKDEHVDQVTPVVERALALCRGAGIEGKAVEAEQPDLLGDVTEVLAGQDVRAPQVAARLRDRPGYPDGLTGSGLVVRLRDEHGIAVRKKDGDATIRARDVAEALAGRDTDTEQTD